MDIFGVWSMVSLPHFLGGFVISLLAALTIFGVYRLFCTTTVGTTTTAAVSRTVRSFTKHIVGGRKVNVNAEEVQLIGNPHDTTAEYDDDVIDALVERCHLIQSPIPTTQPDTFQNLFYCKLRGIPVPIFRMKQPARISEEELPFDLVLVRELGDAASSLISESPMDMEMAKDSWFLGYYWIPLMISCEDETYRHVGWKYVALDGEETKKGMMSYFYALMVNIDDERKIVLSIV